ncbi:blue copper protein-like [Gastrolobium bilobum]|uniref:blue copper protein-like n=1 Tax=Gastrolobium bilobum TaxID=150636 RepID=UPI002AB279A9|nr:blue copper protein-like [Gastrolobium bilobum]
MASSIAFILVLFLAINMALPTTRAAIHTVGDTTGWTIGADYSTWASNLTFVVGDSLVFNYEDDHTVDEVKESDYKTCTWGNSMSTDSSGTTTVALKTAGTHYFICGIPGHCESGMKLAVTVKAKARKAAAPAPTPSPSPSPSPSPAPSPSPSRKGSPSNDTAETPSTTTPITPTTTTTNASPPNTSNVSSATSYSPIVAMLIVSWISYCVLRVV